MLMVFVPLFVAYAALLYLFTLPVIDKKIYRQAGLICFYLWFFIMVPIGEYIFRPSDGTVTFGFLNTAAILLLSVPLVGPFLLARVLGKKSRR